MIIRVHTLGQSVIEVGRRTITPTAEYVFATLLYLSAERGRRVERDRLCTLLWPRENRRAGLKRGRLSINN